jgi:hypothetical protein
MDPEVIEEVEEEPSLRDQLELAIDEHDPQHELVPASEPPASAMPGAEGAVSPEPSPNVASEAAPTRVAPVPQEVGAQGAASTELKAPAQWKPAVREQWNRLPRAVQEEITRRESDSMRLIGSVGPKIRMADEVQAHLAPFAERLSQNGVGSSAFLGDVFGSIKTLASGNAQERAEVVANIVQSYGVDVRALDAILTRRINQPPEVAEARAITAQARAVIQQQHAGVEQQSAAEAAQALAAFAADPKHEFLGEVRTLMADLIDSGRAKTLDEAYSAAIWANPDTRKILLQREAQNRAQRKNNRAIVARTASASVHGAPAVTGAAANNGSQNMSLRDSIEAAFDEHSSL